MANFTLVNSALQVVNLNPEWDIKFDGAKIESAHRARSGAGYRYKWGSYERAAFTVEHLSSSDMSTLNAWWSANLCVRLFDASSTIVISGYLVNATKPIDSYVMPYTDLFKGVIELETF